MVFLSPYFLLGILGVAAPILIHLLNRYRPKTVKWGAMEFLRRALAVRSRQIRMEDLILLLLRCLVVALLALALARPTIAQNAGGIFGESSTGMVIAIDGSYSMAHKGAVTTRFTRAVERARDILATVEPGTPVTVVVMGSAPQTRLRNVGYDPRRFDKFLKDLQDSGPLNERLLLEANLEHLVAMLRDIKAPSHECYIISDAQTESWDFATRHASDKAKAALAQISEIGKLYYVPTGSDSSENVAVTKLELVSGLAGGLTKGAIAGYAATVHNYGKQRADGVVVKLSLDEQVVSQSVIDVLEPGEAKTATLSVTFEKSGPARLTASIGADPLAADNARYAVADVKDMVRVLLVDGKPNDDPEKTETFFLARALNPRIGSDRPWPVRVTTAFPKDLPTTLDARNLADFDIVMLANVSDLDTQQVETLYNFVNLGGSMVVFPGDRVQAGAFNLSMRHDGKPFMPAVLEEPVGSLGEQAQGWMIEPTESANTHFLANVVNKVPKEMLSEKRVLRYFRTELLPDSREILHLAGAPIAASATSHPSQGAGALLVERQVGRGKILMFTTTANRAWGDLAINAVYAMVLQQALTYLPAQHTETPNFAGQTVPLKLPLPARTEGGKGGLTIRDPSGREYAVQAGIAKDSPGQLTGELTQSGLLGFYEISPTGVKSAGPMVVAINADTAESNVDTLAPESLKKAMDNVGATVLAGSDDLAATIKQGRVGYELWRILMLVVLGCLVLESLLARRFSKRIAARSAAAGAEAAAAIAASAHKAA